ncbi:hypothetical protein ACS0TY_004183 [Phlomoides rotata]
MILDLLRFVDVYGRQMKTKGNRDYLISLHKKRDDLLQSLIIKVMRDRGRGREKNKKKKGTLILVLASKASFGMEALFMMLGSAVHQIRTAFWNYTSSVLWHTWKLDCLSYQCSLC